MKCPQCAAQNPDERRTCQRCNSPLPRAVVAASPSKKPVTGSSSVTQLPTQYTPRSKPPDKTINLPQTVSGSSTGGGPKRYGPLEPGAVLAQRYEVQALLGEGGMGEVYRVHDRELDKIIALKTMRGDAGAGSESLARFKQELLLTRDITHKNVIRIYDIGEAEGLRFITMELIDGKDLKEVIEERGVISPEETTRIIAGVLAALEAAHEKGVVHRDLKPQNIMIEKDGTPRIMDFGIARSVEKTGMTATGSVLGTPDYMSPEQASGQKADYRSDLFSVGIIMYEMLTGELPYQADSAISRVMMRLTHKPAPPRELNVSIPKYLEGVVLRCMEVDPELRYHSAREVLHDLAAEQVSRSFTSYTLRAQRAVARRWGIVLAAGVAAVAVAAAIYFANRSPADRAAEAELATATDQSSEPVSYVAILPFTNATGAAEYQWMRTGLPEMLTTDISQSRYVRPVPSERVLRVMDELGISEQTRFDEATLDTISSRLHADSALYGQFVEAGGNLRLDLTLRKTGSGVPIPLKLEAKADAVFDLVDRITGEVKAQLDLSPDQLKGDTDRPISEVSTSSLAALRSYQSGLASLRAGAGQDAIDALEAAVKDDPGFAAAYGKLAEAYLEAGRDPDAERAIERAARLAEESTTLPLPERYQIHALAARAQHDLHTAAESYTQLATLYPYDPDLTLSLASTYEEMGLFHEAGDAYARLLELEPESAEGRFGLAWARLGSGQADECIALLEEDAASDRYAGNPEALGMLHSILGVAYREKADPARSLEHLELSLHYREEAGDVRGQAITLGNISQIHEHLGNVDEAIKGQRQALALIRQLGDRESESDLLFEIGRTYNSAGRLDDSLKALKDSMDIERERQDHANLAIRMNAIGNVYRQKGEYDNALTWLDQARYNGEQAGMKDSLAITDLYIGLIKKAQGRYDQALAVLVPALASVQELDDQMSAADIHRVLGEIYIDQGRYNDAYEAMTQSMETYSHIHAEHDIAELKPQLGRLLVLLGQFDAAEKELAEGEEMAHHGGGGHAAAELLLGRAELAALQGAEQVAAQAFRDANVAANESKLWEVAVRSRIALGHLYLNEERRGGSEGNPLGILERALAQAKETRLRPLEAAALAGLAEVYLERNDPTTALEHAQQAVSLAKELEARPTLYEAYAQRGEALVRLGRKDEGLGSYRQAVETFEWIRGSLKPEHAESFLTRSDVQEFMHRTVAALEQSGKPSEAEPLKRWLASGATASGGR